MGRTTQSLERAPPGKEPKEKQEGVRVRRRWGMRGAQSKEVVSWWRRARQLTGVRQTTRFSVLCLK